MVQSHPIASLTQRLQLHTSLPPSAWPTEQELPDTDHKPVDNELQLLIPTLLRSILALAWSDHMDWFLGINMGVYYQPPRTCIGPDAFLSLGVDRYRPDKSLRLSYVLWAEQVVPQWCLEIVSQEPGNEYTRKFNTYTDIGVLYYVIYNPDYHQRDGHPPLEVYKLVDGIYTLQQGPIVWMPELGLGIGRDQGTHDGLTREWLYWYDAAGQPYPTPNNMLGFERTQRLTAQRLHLAEQQLRQQTEHQLSQEQQLRQQTEDQLSQAQQEIQQLRDRLQQLDLEADRPTEP